MVNNQIVRQHCIFLGLYNQREKAKLVLIQDSVELVLNLVLYLLVQSDFVFLFLKESLWMEVGLSGP